MESTDIMPLREKLKLGFWLTLWLAVPYYLLQHVELRQVQVIPKTYLDSLISFEPLSVWPYLSIYIYMPIVGWLILPGGDYLRWCKGLAWIGLISHLAFLLWPTGIDRQVLASSFAHEMVLNADKTRNACPSLHASMTIFCMIFVFYLDGNRSNLLQIGFALWGLLILWSTMALEQHVFIDIAVGGMVGIVIAYFMLERNPNKNL
ncbi:MAG: phosphatase PAP2 family protein [Calditrichia bacterium]